MTTRPLSPRTAFHHPSGKVSLAVVLGLCVVLLVAALGLAGYAWYSTRSENARLQSEARKVEADRQTADLQRQTEALAVEKAEAAARLILAKNQQEAFAGSVRKLTNTLESLLVQIPAWHEQLESLRTGEPGRKVAQHPELVATARVLFERDARAVPAREDAVQHLEALRRVLLQLADNAGTAFQPTPQMTAALEAAQTWTVTATERLAAARGFAESLLREAQIKVPPPAAGTPPPTLQVAVDALKEGERTAYLAKETQVIGAATTEATNVLLAVRTNEIANTAEIARQRAADEARAKQAEQDRESARLAEEVEQKRLADKARSVEVQNVLSSFLTPGNWQPKNDFTLEKQPISYSKLQAAGALKPDLAGIQNLKEIATTPRDKVRPRMITGRPKYNTKVLDTYQEAQALLIELGPTLVKLGLLAP